MADQGSYTIQEVEDLYLETEQKLAQANQELSQVKDQLVKLKIKYQVVKSRNKELLAVHDDLVDKVDFHTNMAMSLRDDQMKSCVGQLNVMSQIAESLKKPAQPSRSSSFIRLSIQQKLADQHSSPLKMLLPPSVPPPSLPMIASSSTEPPPPSDIAPDPEEVKKN